ncbi:MAG TPA: metallophosphoesterase [Edaphobacter sp.]|nr:metallophosphoesterase [Edaphobacter sp.]
MADTQWSRDDGRNPGACAVDIVKAVNKEFIKHKVDFVIEVGDLVDKTGNTADSVAVSEDVRAAFAQELYNAGIGFFPVRGNHDSNPLAAAEFKRIYPQSQNGRMNATPPNVFTIPNPDAAAQPFPSPSGSPFTLETNFSSPDPSTTGGLDWRGLSYSFDYKGSKFVLIDQFAPADRDPARNQQLTIALQVSWIASTLSAKPVGGHAFVFAHKGLISEQHVDTLFGKDPSQDVAAQDAFITAMYKNGVRYYIQGHDHLHNRALVSVTGGSPLDGVSPKVENIISQSDSHKFYTPNIPSNDDQYDVPAFGHTREAEISQNLHQIGFYIYTVDGPRVTVKYYAAAVPNAAPIPKCKLASPEMCEYTAPTTPPLIFKKLETFGYSLNGKEFLICQAHQEKCGNSYTKIADSYKRTSMKILSGENRSTAQDFQKRPFIKTVDTGWTDQAANTLSDILTLWGMEDFNAKNTDTYTLSLVYSGEESTAVNDLPVLATRAKQGKWINAVDKNDGGSKKFVNSPWKKGYALGTYGFDQRTKSVWAVVNYTGDFAVAHPGK